MFWVTDLTPVGFLLAERIVVTGAEFDMVTEDEPALGLDQVIQLSVRPSLFYL